MLSDIFTSQVVIFCLLLFDQKRQFLLNEAVASVSKRATDNSQCVTSSFIKRNRPIGVHQLTLEQEEQSFRA